MPPIVPPDDLDTIRFRLERLEKNMERVETQRLPDMLSQGRSWHSSMLTAVAELERRLLGLPTQLDDRYLLLRDAQERRQDTQTRLVALEAKSEQCVSKPDAVVQHQILKDGLESLRSNVERFQSGHAADHRKDDEAHQKVHDRAQDEHTKLLYWILGAYAAAAIALAQQLFRIFSDNH